MLAFLPPQPGAVCDHFHELLIAHAHPPLFVGEIKKLVADLVLGHVAELVIAVVVFSRGCVRGSRGRKC